MPEVPEQEPHATALDVRSLHEEFFFEFISRGRTLRLVRRPARPGRLFLQQLIATCKSEKCSTWNIVQIYLFRVSY